MSSRVIIDESAKRVLEESIYSGTKYINTTKETDVTGCVNAQVSGADIIAPINIKKDVTILGVEGSYDGEPSPSPNKLTFNTNTEGGYIVIGVIGHPEIGNIELHNGDSVNIEDIPNFEGEFNIILYAPYGSNVTFKGVYGGSEYEVQSLSFDGIILYPPIGSQGKWLINKFGSDCTITVASQEEKQYIYEKGEDSDVEFDLHDGYDDHRIEPGANLEVDYPYWVTSDGVSCDFYINGNLMLQDVAEYYFTLTEDMSVNNKVVITVKKHAQPPEAKKFTVVNNTNYRIELYNTNKEKSIYVDSNDQTVIDVGTEVGFRISIVDYQFGDQYEARFSGFYDDKDKEYRDYLCRIIGDMIYHPGATTPMFDLIWNMSNSNYGTLVVSQ